MSCEAYGNVAGVDVVELFNDDRLRAIAEIAERLAGIDGGSVVAGETKRLHDEIVSAIRYVEQKRRRLAKVWLELDYLDSGDASDSSDLMSEIEKFQ